VPRVTDTEVKAIIDTEIDTTPFIATANTLVNNLLSDSGLDDTTLASIELWLSAHYVAVRDPRFRSVRTEQHSMEFERGQAGMGIRATTYGQQALELDTSGTLAAQLGRRRAFIRVD
jgi:hypothetical protein